MKPPLPSPWSVKSATTCDHIMSGDHTVARVHTHNSRNYLPLLFAAPELLDMCERLLGFAIYHADPTALAAWNGMIESAQEVIAKARGEKHA
jgi:hypothetical protein